MCTARQFGSDLGSGVGLKEKGRTGTEGWSLFITRNSPPEKVGASSWHYPPALESFALLADDLQAGDAGEGTASLGDGPRGGGGVCTTQRDVPRKRLGRRPGSAGVGCW